MLRPVFLLLYHYFLRIHFQKWNDWVQRYAMFYILTCITNCVAITSCQAIHLPGHLRSLGSLLPESMLAPFLSPSSTLPGPLPLLFSLLSSEGRSFASVTCFLSPFFLELNSSKRVLRASFCQEWLNSPARTFIITMILIALTRPSSVRSISWALFHLICVIYKEDIIICTFQMKNLKLRDVR